MADNDPNYHERLRKCLETELRHPNCARATWRHNSSAMFNRVTASADGNCLYWVDNKKERLSLSFPAVLDLEGNSVRMDPYLNFNNFNVV